MTMKILKKPFTIQSMMLLSKESTNQSDGRLETEHLQNLRSCEDPANKSILFLIRSSRRLAGNSLIS